MLLFVLLVGQVFPAVAQAQIPRLNSCWPAFDYDGKPAQADTSYARTTVAGSQTETARYAAESRTMTAADGRLQVRLDGKTYKGFPAEEYAVLVANLCDCSITGRAHE